MDRCAPLLHPCLFSELFCASPPPLMPHPPRLRRQEGGTHIFRDPCEVLTEDTDVAPTWVEAVIALVNVRVKSRLSPEGLADPSPRSPLSTRNSGSAVTVGVVGED